MHPKDLRIEDYTYDLPDDRIAKYPLDERDASKLLIYRDGQIAEDIYRNIDAHIPAGTLMVFNQTRVVHARLLFKKPSGGQIEVFCLSPFGYADIHTAMLQKGAVEWECLVGGASKWKPGMILELHHGEPRFTLYAALKERTPNGYILSLSWDNRDLTFAEVLHYTGKVPLPPYLHRDADVTDEQRYQTVFAKEEGSVAAPTAGLHFTPGIMDGLKMKGIDTTFLTLHVGAGTFKPVKSETMQDHEMHAEWIEVSRQTVQQLLEAKGKTVAVGTTSLRTLESLYWIGNKLKNKEEPDLHGVAVSQWDPYRGQPACTRSEALEELLWHMKQNSMDKILTRTQIMIAPGYDLRMTDALVTNFHQPQSTLLLLVAALIGDSWLAVYQYAMDHAYRFLSYGDGSLLWRK